ncbi:unnamed protein product [Amoebophrya sp. A25]|nr:unnamed protein product [Amoebophrya sp. A25]|eukprot:GSA25T00014792001.1
MTSSQKENELASEQNLSATNDTKEPTISELAKQFSILGTTCFGGPSVHLGVFQQMFVGKWFSAALFAELMAFAHVLPGPTSTQVAFLIGLVVLKQGRQDFIAENGRTNAIKGSSTLTTSLLGGGDRAPSPSSGTSSWPWFVPGLVSGGCFILPGFLFMCLLGYLTNMAQSAPSGADQSHIAACCLIGLASVGWGMVGSAAKGMIGGTCAGSPWKLTVCGGSCVVTLLLYPTPYVDYVFPLVILTGGVVAVLKGGAAAATKAPSADEENQQADAKNGSCTERTTSSTTRLVRENPFAVCVLILWTACLGYSLSFAPSDNEASTASKNERTLVEAQQEHLQPQLQQEDGRLFTVFPAFYTTGALVFGGGPVVLPLLDKKLVDTGRITSSEFLAGLSLGQGIPGPMFNLGTFLGALCLPQNPFLGAVQGCLGIFLPGVLLIFGLFPFWSALREKSTLYQSALPGMNSAATGLIGASVFVLYHQLTDQVAVLHGGDDAKPSLSLGAYIVPAVAIIGALMTDVLKISQPLAIIGGGVFTAILGGAGVL